MADSSIKQQDYKRSRTSYHRQSHAIKKSTMRKEINKSLKRRDDGYSSSDYYDRNWVLSATNDSKVNKRLSSDNLESSKNLN